jgi:hypothetical protein
MAEEKRVPPRVLDHVETLRQAGLDSEAFFQALVGIRDDSTLPNEHRDVLYRLIAMESYVWYLEALRGEPIDREELIKEAQQAAENEQAVIKKPSK